MSGWRRFTRSTLKKQRSTDQDKDVSDCEMESDQDEENHNQPDKSLSNKKSSRGKPSQPGRHGKKAKISKQSTSSSTDPKLQSIPQQLFTDPEWDKVEKLAEKFSKSYQGQSKKFSQLHGNISRWMWIDHKVDIDNELERCEGFTTEERALLHTLAKFCIFMLA